MGRLRTFERLEAHAHRELKSPRDLQKARGWRSDPRAKHPNPATSGRGGKITHRHPHLPAMESLSPRLRKLVNDQCGSEAKTLAEVMVQEGVTTCQAAACHADSGAQFAEKLGSANIGLQSVWRLADVEFDAHLAACARVERVAHMHTLRVKKPRHAAGDAHVRAHCQEAEVRSCTCGPAASGKRRAAEAGQGHPAGVRSPRDNEAMVNTTAKL